MAKIRLTQIKDDTSIMLKSTYDTNTNNVVDNAASLNGQEASYYLDFDNFANTPTILRKYAADISNPLSATILTITHSLGTKDVIVQIYDNSSPYEQVEVPVEHYSTDSIKLYFKDAPTSNQYRVIIIG